MVVEASERIGNLVALVRGDVRVDKASKEGKREGAVLVLANLLVRENRRHGAKDTTGSWRVCRAGPV